MKFYVRYHNAPNINPIPIPTIVCSLLPRKYGEMDNPKIFEKGNSNFGLKTYVKA